MEGPTENIVKQEDINVGQGMWGEEVSYMYRRKEEWKERVNTKHRVHE